jgi:hypothetical protein
MLYQTVEGPYVIQAGTIAYKAPDTQPLWILSSGWSPATEDLSSPQGNPNGEFIRRFLKRNVVHGPCLTFVYNDTRRVFNFGQDTDQKKPQCNMSASTGKTESFLRAVPWSNSYFRMG